MIVEMQNQHMKELAHLQKERDRFASEFQRATDEIVRLNRQVQRFSSSLCVCFFFFWLGVLFSHADRNRLEDEKKQQRPSANEQAFQNARTMLEEALREKVSLFLCHVDQECVFIIVFADKNKGKSSASTAIVDRERAVIMCRRAIVTSRTSMSLTLSLSLFSSSLCS